MENYINSDKSILNKKKFNFQISDESENEVSVAWVKDTRLRKTKPQQHREAKLLVQASEAVIAVNF